MQARKRSSRAIRARTLQISELATAARLPAMYAYPEFVSSGGLMAYGVELSEVYRGAAGQIDQILRGTKPGEIPFQQATKFVFAINLKTAKTLGIVVPPVLLSYANEVIEMKTSDFRLWHNPEMTTSLLYVRYRVGSGKHLLPASISAFDPTRTSIVQARDDLGSFQGIKLSRRPHIVGIQ
jgi:hypothetical protein